MVYQYTIPFKEGLHSRPAIGLTDLCKKYDKINIHITKINDKAVNIKGRNLIAILTANIEQKDVIEITIGDNATSMELNDIKKELDKIFIH